MIKHTPGPWSVEINRESNILDSAGNRVAVACQTCWPDEGTDRIDDNARLIAAAPAMLLALQELIAEREAYNPTGGILLALDAVALATGAT